MTRREGATMRHNQLIEWPERRTAAARAGKAVQPTQAAIDALPFGSGTWRIQGIMGLYVRCRSRSKSYLLQRRVSGRLVQRVLGPMTLPAAKRAAMKEWAKLKPAPPDGKITLAQAWEACLAEKPLAAKTRQIYSEHLARYLADWKDRTLESIGVDRAGFRARVLAVARGHGRAAAASLLRTFRAIYNYHRRVNPDLPENPSFAVDEPRIPARDWALSDDELRRWWAAVERLKPLKRTWWLTALLTGARAGSISGLGWQDVDFERKVIHFRVAKAGRAYSIPMSDRLAAVLAGWRQQAPPSEWVFPSPVHPDRPLHDQVRDDKRGVPSPHHLRHTMRTRLAEVGATPDLARVALGHSLAGDVSRGYITPHLLLEAVRPLLNAVAETYAGILGGLS
jgi:integrase